MNENSVNLYNETAKRLNETYSEQEVFWRQKCKQLWLREGDSNNKFFHAAAKSQRKINNISSLTNNTGVSVGWDSGQKKVLIDYFFNLFKATDTELNEVISCVDRRISEEQNIVF